MKYNSQVWWLWWEALQYFCVFMQASLHMVMRFWAWILACLKVSHILNIESQLPYDFLAIYMVASMLFSFSMSPTFFSIFFCMFLVALVFWKTNSKVTGGIGLLPFQIHLKICNILGRDVAIGSVDFVVPLHSWKCISSYFSLGWLLADNNLLANGPCYFRLPFQINK